MPVVLSLLALTTVNALKFDRQDEGVLHANLTESLVENDNRPLYSKTVKRHNTDYADNSHTKETCPTNQVFDSWKLPVEGQSFHYERATNWGWCGARNGQAGNGVEFQGCVCSMTLQQKPDDVCKPECDQDATCKGYWGDARYYQSAPRGHPTNWVMSSQKCSFITKTVLSTQGGACPAGCTKKSSDFFWGPKVTCSNSVNRNSRRSTGCYVKAADGKAPEDIDEFTEFKDKYRVKKADTKCSGSKYYNYHGTPGHWLQKGRNECAKRCLACKKCVGFNESIQSSKAFCKFKKKKGRVKSKSAGSGLTYFAKKATSGFVEEDAEETMHVGISNVAQAQASPKLKQIPGIL